MPISVRDQTQLTSDFTSKYNQIVPGLDVGNGSTEKSIFVDAPIQGGLADIENNLGYAAACQSLLNWASLQNSDLANECANYLGQNPRIQAKKSAGTVWFYASVSPSADITIPLGTRVSTVDGTTFQTTSEMIMYYTIISTYYDPTLGKWGIEVPVESVDTGAARNIGSGLITALISPIPGISSTNNIISMSGGADAETNQSMVNRAMAAFQSRGLERTQGLTNWTVQQDNVVDAFTVEAGDAMMVRDDGLGGKLDEYVRGTVNTPFVQYATVSSSGYLYLAHGPFIAMTSLVGAKTYVLGVDYNVVLDTGMYAKSSRELTKIVFTSTGPAIGEDIVIQFQYNGLMDTLYNLTLQPASHITNRDILFFTTNQVLINFSMDVYISGDQATIDAAIRTALANSINAMRLGSKVEKASEFTIVDSIQGVSNLPLANFIMLPTGGGTVDVNGDIVLSAREYPQVGTINISYLV